MSTKADNKAEQQTDTLGWLKWLVALAFVAAAVVGNSYFSEELLIIRVVGIVVAIILAAVVASFTLQGKAFVDLFTEARKEIKKVVWPTQQETVQTTGIVLVVIVLMALLMFFFDWVLNLAVSALIG